MILAVVLLQASVTNCVPSLGSTTCTTRTEPTQAEGPIDYGASTRSQPLSEPLYMPSTVRAGGDYKPTKRQKKAGALIANGDCAGAEQYALREGDFALASTVRLQCTMRKMAPAQ